MRVIVTRPEPDCSRWVLLLQQHGLQAAGLPLLAIGPVQDPGPVHVQWRQLARYCAVMFVSGAAVQHFFDLRPEDVMAPPAGLRCWAPGPGTAAALARRGLPLSSIDAPPVDGAQFDSEALWQVVGGGIRAGDAVLIVRGAAGDDVHGRDEPAVPGAGRDWLAHALAAAGAEVATVVAYERCAPRWNVDQFAMARGAASDGSLWLFTSSQAITHLVAALPEQSWQQARALATHPRVVHAAREAGFGVVGESRPRVADVVASIESGA